MPSLQPPQFPAGPQDHVDAYDPQTREVCLETLAQAPQRLRDAVEGLSEAQLDTKYKNWTIRQIVHHLADSHVQAYIRFKWALTEPNPTIKAYEEGDWVVLADSQEGELAPSLALLDGLHQKWVQLLNSMQPEQFARTFVHPQSGETVSLWASLQAYPWHGRHHTAQIRWIRDQNDW